VTRVRRQHSLFRASRVFHFGNPRRARTTDPAHSSEGTIVHVMIRIEDHCQDLLLDKSQVDLEILVVLADHPLRNDLGFVDVLMIIVVLDQRQHVSHSCASNEGGGDPIVDQPIRHFDWPPA